MKYRNALLIMLSLMLPLIGSIRSLTSQGTSHLQHIFPIFLSNGFYSNYYGSLIFDPSLLIVPPGREAKCPESTAIFQHMLKRDEVWFQSRSSAL